MKTISNALISTFTGNANEKQMLITFSIVAPIVLAIILSQIR